MDSTIIILHFGSTNNIFADCSYNYPAIYFVLYIFIFIYLFIVSIYLYINISMYCLVKYMSQQHFCLAFSFLLTENCWVYFWFFDTFFATKLLYNSFLNSFVKFWFQWIIAFLYFRCTENSGSGIQRDTILVRIQKIVLVIVLITRITVKFK